jgi:MOSC domain-containing protein YiiM
MKVLQVCVSKAREVRIDGRAVRTGIFKRPVDGPVAVGPTGLEGDEQADPTVHGGLSKAVYAYPSEHAAFWQTVRAQARVAAPGAPIEPGLFGENLLLQGVQENALWIGDRLLLPRCVLVVSEPRFPCLKFNAALGFAQAAKMMTQSAWCGAYLAVLEGGFVQAGDSFTLQPGPREVGLTELFRARLKGPPSGR